MATYHLNVVVADDGTVIPLRYIESMNFTRDGEEAVIDKLRDDCAINVVTLSGQKFLISMEMQMHTFPNQIQGIDPEDLMQAIYDKWIRIFN